jgi:molybdopterin-guanine dinucleotide biosynthesis protein MobB
MIIVSLIGLKKCGKTTTAEALIREFKKRGYKTGGVKSMPHSNFTIDVQGKDTWRQKEAGADFVISLSKHEIAYIEPHQLISDSNDRPSLEDVLRLVPQDTEVLICEGLTEDDPRIIRVVLAKSPELVKETFEVRGLNKGISDELFDGSSKEARSKKEHGWNIEDGTKVEGNKARILAFSGIMTNEIGDEERINGFPDIPVFNCVTEGGAGRLADLIITRGKN